MALTTTATDIIKKAKNASGNLQDRVLSHLVSQKQLVDVYLVNGIRLQGYINAFDNYAVFLTKSPDDVEVLISHMIYKHAISTIGNSTQ